MKAGWKKCRLGDLSDVITKGTTPTSVGFQFTEDGINFIKVESVTSDHRLNPDRFAKIDSGCHAALKRSQIQENDILFSIAGALGRCAIANKGVLPANTNQALAIIRLSDLNQSTPEYVLYALQSAGIVDQIECDRAGSAQQNLSLKQVSDFQIPLPPPDEQRRIVAVLDKAFAGIATATANAHENLTNARALFESYAEALIAKESGSDKKALLKSITDRITNGYVGPTRDIYVESGIPYLLARQVKNNTLKFDSRTFISPEFNEKIRKSKLLKGDVLLVQSGHIGHSAVVPLEHQGHNCHAMIVITPKAMLNGEFLSLFFNTAGMKRKFAEIRSGSTVPHLTCKLVRELMIPLPSISKQLEIVVKCSEVRTEALALESHYGQKLAALTELKQSLLHKAFAGELT